VGEAAFHLKLARSGRLVPVAGDQSALDALQQAGVEVPLSCQQGVCGTCLTRVIEGEVEHWDLYLTPEEQAAGDCFLPCVSRAAGDLLVLDL